MSPRNTAWIASLLAALVVAPMLAHVAWRPLAHALHGPTEGVAFSVSLAALVVTGIAGSATLWRQRGGAAPLSWGLTALACVGLGAAVAGLPGALTLLAVAGLIAALLPGRVAELEACQAQLPAPSPLKLALWSAAVLLCVATSVSLATYFGDPQAEGFGVLQGTHLYRHLCMSAYLHAAELVRLGADNIYDLSRAAEGSDLLPDTAAHMAPFKLDRFGYPPQFVLLPLALITALDDFTAQRAVWCCANALVMAGVLWKVGLWVGPRSGRVLRAVAPLLWTIGGATYQSGNIHLTVYGLGLLAMLAFDGRRDRLGGALLASVTLSKISPGLLGVLLLVQRRWRGVAWTVIAAGVLSALALVFVGPDSFVDFLTYHLPKVSSGEAYDFLDDTPENIANNLAPFGIPFKLAALGVRLDPWAWAPRLASAYTALAFVMAVLAGRRSPDRRGHVALWSLVLTFAGLRSPMAPGYLLAGVFLSLALGAAELRTWRGWALGFGLAVALTLLTPFVTVPLQVILAGQALMHGLIVWLMLREWPSLDPEHPPHALGADAAT